MSSKPTAAPNAATTIALYHREESEEIVVTCDEHATGRVVIAPRELEDLLWANGVTLGPRQRPDMAKLSHKTGETRVVSS